MFQIGAMAVYPAHGVGIIESIQQREVAGFQQSFYIMRLLDTDMIIMIPTQNAKNIVALATSNDQVKNMVVSGEAHVAPWFRSIQSVWEKGLEDLEADWQKWALKSY